MGILAVIPARAGSKGIPNKNIRFVNGKPLIYYAIRNACSSKLITDVVVSTDSADIEIIARQMGVNVKRRASELAGDDVTLDPVIYDAAKEYGSDYVITMQPTSPTLQVETLDAAIRHCIDGDFDTVVSAINKPHLAWIEKDGVKKPAYKARLNRQYLPPYYLETGAFFISKTSAITSVSRFGAKVDVYELSETEGVDVDSFNDLCQVEMILSRKNIAIYVNGNNKRGIGHIYRALELADEFYVKPDIYYDINQTEKKAFGFTTHNLLPVNGIGELLPKLKSKQYDIFINDILTTTIDYMIAIREALPNSKLINFEDDGEGVYNADLVINALYQDDCTPNVKAGEKYYMASKLFMFYDSIKIKEHVEKVFISFGGADPQNYTDRLLEIITKDKYKNLMFSVVLGREKMNVSELMKYNQYENIEVRFDVRNMPEIMSQCDIGVTSCGRTSYELAMLGVPAIVMAQNQREKKHSFVNNYIGFTYLGLNPRNKRIEASLDTYIKMSEPERERYQKLLLSYDLRNGRKRVMSLINNL
ncbi:MAG: cytidyltransferase [Clostridiales bacterium]|nr:cytidyltransferase [Clostridiales bacterium]